MRARALILIALLAIIGIFYKHSINLDSKLRQSAQEIEQLKRALENERTNRTTLENEIKNVSAAPQTAALERPPELPTKNTAPSVKEESDSAFILSAGMSQVERVLALSQEEKDTLRQKLSERIANGNDDVNPYLEALGPARFEEFKNKQFEFRVKLRDEFIEQEVFTLSRKLSLSPQQEQNYQNILKNSRNNFFPITLDDPVKLSTAAPNAEETKTYFDKELKRQEFVRQSLKPILSDEQMNKYLEMEATSSANIAHSAFVDASKDSQKKE